MVWNTRLRLITFSFFFSVGVLCGDGFKLYEINLINVRESDEITGTVQKEKESSRIIQLSSPPGSHEVLFKRASSVEHACKFISEQKLFFFLRIVFTRTLAQYRPHYML